MAHFRRLRRTLGLALPGVLAALCAAARAAEPAAALTLDPPPGWQDVTAGNPNPDVVVALKGPETSSFVLSRVRAMDLSDRGVTRTLLVDILTELNQKTGLGFTQASNLIEASYDNDLKAYYVRANYKGKPRLILAVMEYGQTTMVATLISAVPDTLLPSILGGLSTGRQTEGRRREEGRAESLDDQLAFELPAGLSARALTESEKKLGFVLAVSGFGSEMMIMKLVDDSTPLKDQPQVVKDTVLSVNGAQPDSLSEVALYRTPPGPDLVYAWAGVKDAGGPSQFAAGYMPWCYWGYSVLAKGPRAADLVAEAFKTLSLGSSALPKLLAETPRVPVPGRSGVDRWWILLGLGAAAAALAVLVRRPSGPQAPRPGAPG